jgi:hypothetical protein
MSYNDQENDIICHPRPCVQIVMLRLKLLSVKDSNKYIASTTIRVCNVFYLELQDVGCLRDLPHLYEVTTAEDVYNAYNYLSLDEGSLFTCIGIAGTEAGKGEIVEVTEETPVDEPIGGMQGPIIHGRGLTTMTRPTT